VLSFRAKREHSPDYAMKGFPWSSVKMLSQILYFLDLVGQLGDEF